MASVFKRKDRTGDKKRVWYFRFKDFTGKYRYGTGWTSKKKTIEHALAVEAEHRAIRKGEKEPPPSWLVNRNKPITEAVTAYLKWGRAHGGRNQRPWAKQHAQQKERWLAWWIKALDLKRLADINLEDVERVAQEYARTRSEKTTNHKLSAIHALCRWAVVHHFLGADPLKGYTKFNDEPSSPHRTLDPGELAALFRVATPEHLVWYKVALATGYRVGELKHLKVKDLDMFMPGMNLAAEHTKNRKSASQPIPRELADVVVEACKGKGPDDSLLDIPMREAWEPFNEDRGAAGILTETSEGRATWHSLRKVYVDAVVRTGADLKTIGTLARHSWQKEKITMDTYAKEHKERLKAAAVAAYQDIMRAIEKSSSGFVLQAAAVNEPTPIKKAPSGAYDVEVVVGDTGLEPVTSWV